VGFEPQSAQLNALQREDGSWVRKTAEGEAPPPPFNEKEIRSLFQWLVG